VPPPNDHAERLAAIRLVCEAADEMHDRTVRIVETLSQEPRYLTGTRLLNYQPASLPERKRKRRT